MNMIEEMSGKLSANFIELQTAARLYLVAKAMEEEVLAIKKDIWDEVLAENCYYPRPDVSTRLADPDKRIDEADNACLMTEDDFKDFMEKCYVLYKERGIANPRGKDYIPEQDVQETRIKAENVLLDEFWKICPTGFEAEDYERARKHILHRRKLIELAVGIADIKEAEI